MIIHLVQMLSVLYYNNNNQNVFFFKIRNSIDVHAKWQHYLESVIYWLWAHKWNLYCKKYTAEFPYFVIYILYIKHAQMSLIFLLILQDLFSKFFLYRFFNVFWLAERTLERTQSETRKGWSWRHRNSRTSANATKISLVWFQNRMSR